MIGTVGSPAKAAVALEHGYDAVIDYTAEDFAARTLELPGGRGVDVVYDGIGKAAFLRSLACIRPRGMAVSYGTASGTLGPFDLQVLHAKSRVVPTPALPTRGQGNSWCGSGRSG